MQCQNDFILLYLKYFASYKTSYPPQNLCNLGKKNPVMCQIDDAAVKRRHRSATTHQNKPWSLMAGITNIMLSPSGLNLRILRLVGRQEQETRAPQLARFKLKQFVVG